MSDIDLSAPRRIHLVGIGGVGLSAYATVLAAMGNRVSGSDLHEGPALDRLRGLGIDVVVGHDGGTIERLLPLDAVVVSTAIPAGNPEIAVAREHGVPILRRAEILAAIAATRRTIAVSGTHGKTTTTALLAHVLVKAGQQASFLVGGDVHEFGSGAVWSEGELLVVEADESDGTFLELPRRGAIVTSVEADHLDYFGSIDAIEAAFAEFLAGTDGPRVVCADDPTAGRLGRAYGAITYGTAPDADYQLVDVELERSTVRFTLVDRHGKTEGPGIALTVPAPGLHNARNAAAAFVMATALGVTPAAAAAALQSYGGVARRFHLRAEVGGVSIIDDYAHNPGKVGALVKTASQGGWSRVICVFQPHRYTRTATLGTAFADSFEGADVVLVTDVYGAGEDPIPGISGMTIVRAILEAHPWRRVAYLPHRRDVLAYLGRELRPGDLCLTVGAGDITTLADELEPLLAARPTAMAGAPGIPADPDDADDADDADQRGNERGNEADG